MEGTRPLYLTTTLPYVNAAPHIGFALEIVQADIIARYHRLAGRDVFFSTGTDEHGQKIAQKAAEEGRGVQEYVDHFAGQFGRLKDGLNLSNDAFIRTTDPKHAAAAQELWRRCQEAGDIYKKKYKGLYCVGDEMFLKDGDLVDGKCPNHPNMEPVEIEEENYFFRLSAYQDRLGEYLSREGAVLPEWRRQEALNFVNGGLEDFSISRERARMSWGVPVPGDENQVMYVWFDALANYISTLGWPDDAKGAFAKFWDGGEAVQMAGKDQVRFQSVMWQAMLMSAKIKCTDRVVYHGFITSGGQKMSKSLGNVIEPFELIGEYGTDAVRYFLARHVHPFEDSDFTLERFRELYNAGLANGLGNMASRVMTLSENYGVQTALADEQGRSSLEQDVAKAVEKFELNEALNRIWSEIDRIDRGITEKAPFRVIKTDEALGKALIQGFVQDLYAVAKALKPFMPDASEKILAAINENKKPETLFPRKD
jgi:methionyl-tRNA synthetase